MTRTRSACSASSSGREHEVLTGVAVLDRGDGRGRLAAEVDRTAVRMAPLTPEEIAWYVATGEPRDKAGAYAIQGLGALFVEAVSGNYSNVVGLPIPTVYRLFAELGYDLKALRETLAPVLHRLAQSLEREVGHDLVAVEVQDPDVVGAPLQVLGDRSRRTSRSAGAPRRGGPRRR